MAAAGLRRTATTTSSAKKRTSAASSSTRRSVNNNRKLKDPPVSPSNNTVTTTSTSGSSNNNNKNDNNNCEEWENVSEWTEESVQQVAGWWNVDEIGIQKLWQLEERLRDIDHWKNQPNEVVRYLRDAHGNVKLAEHKFRKMVQWRIDNDVDNIVYNYKPPHPLMADYLPTTVLEGTDKGGDPIWLERVGAADSWGLLKTFGQEPLIQYAVYVREVCIRGDWARDYQHKHGKPPSRATAIIDLGGMGWDHCRPALLPLLKDGLHIVQDYYVGFGKKVIVIRTSKLFPIIWKVAQHFCGENLKNMLVFADSNNYLEVLEEYVDLDKLPPCIYPQGTGRGGVAMPSRLEGGKVPSMDELDQMWEKKKQKQQQQQQQQRNTSSTVSTCSVTDEDALSLESSPPSSSRRKRRGGAGGDDNNEKVTVKGARLFGGLWDIYGAPPGDDQETKTVITCTL